MSVGDDVVDRLAVGPSGRLVSDCEWVVLVRDRQMREACIDLKTGAVRTWGERL